MGFAIDLKLYAFSKKAKNNDDLLVLTQLKDLIYSEEEKNAIGAQMGDGFTINPSQDDIESRSLQLENSIPSHYLYFYYGGTRGYSTVTGTLLPNLFSIIHSFSYDYSDWVFYLMVSEEFRLSSNIYKHGETLHQGYCDYNIYSTTAQQEYIKNLIESALSYKRHKICINKL